MAEYAISVSASSSSTQRLPLGCSVPRSARTVALFESKSATTSSSTIESPSSSSAKQENNKEDFEETPPSSVEELLRVYAYGERVIKLEFDQTDGSFIGQHLAVSENGGEESSAPELSSKREVFAEVQDGGGSRICRIIGINKTVSASKKKKAAKEQDGKTIDDSLTRPPRIEIVFVDEGDDDDEDEDEKKTDSNAKAQTKTIDVGQITTVWTTKSDLDSDAYNETPATTAAICEKVEEALPVNHVEDVFENRYKYHVGRGRNIHGGGALTKKQILMISAAASVAAASEASTFDQTEELRTVIDRVLKQCVRCGSKYTRLIDSASLEEWMFYDEVEGAITHDYTSGSDTTLYDRRTFCAMALAEDTVRAGRFKRMPCMWLPPQTTMVGDNDDNNESSTTTLTLVNGGWVVVDQSVRAAAEGRKFAASATASGGRFTSDSNDERILCRLESLACGEKLKQQKKGGGGGIRLEVDVRSTLEAMNLPLSSEGAQEALIQMGRWTKKESNVEDGKGTLRYERWSPSVLEASKWYDQMDRVRRRDMKAKILEQRAKKQKLQDQNKKRQRKPRVPAVLEGRTDLTSLPCICVDAERTTFRDDAFGIRKRSSTGRKVNKKASQWELLFHIADVSDIYAPNPTVVGSACASGTAAGQAESAKASIKQQKKHLQELEKAARSRIRSEYNLPLGPLHLLPTTVLESLSLDAFKQDWTSNPSTWPSSWQTMDEENGTANRAVTLWVYIDERSGFVIDIGFERSIISRPLALTFETATKLLEASDQQQENFPPMLAKARALLTVVERNIEIWSDSRRNKSTGARAREEKLAARELISNQVYGGKNSRAKRRDDGRDGDFRRSRGHRLVDSTLHLYENAFRMMMQKRKAMVPQHLSGPKNRGMRSATAPLRNYLQGLAQRQALAVLCDYGGAPMSNDKCKKIGVEITTAYNARRNSGGATNGPQTVSPRQLAAVRSLKSHLRKHSSTKNRVVPAISTGTNSEVVIQGVGAVASCKEIPGTIKPGVKVMVRILNVDDKNGKVIVALQSKS